MSEERNLLRKIFNEAVEIADAQQRADYLASACGADADLRQRVEELLAADAESGRFLGGVGDTVAKDRRGSTDSSSPHLAFGHPLPSDGRGAGGEGKTFGDYELLEEIARGGMGIVYRARQVSLDRIVAVKLLLLGQYASEEFIHRFRIEASAAASLQHPNIVAIHEVGVHQGQHYFAMDFVDGPDLAKVVRDQPLTAKRAAGYVKTIAEAIHFAHTRRILHRDLKPSNVLIDSNDQPRVTDFGLAKNLSNDSELTLTGQVMGSPGFMPPEQASGERGKLGPASDVYSLGAILYHALTGRAPFVGQTVSDTLQQVLDKEPIAPRLLAPGVPVDLETICLKCLEKEPGKRFASAQALAEELGRFQRDEPIHARPVSAPEKLWRWGRRNRLATAFLGTICLALVSSVGLLLQVNQEKNKLVALNVEVKEGRRVKDDLLKRQLGMMEENLEGIWDNRQKRQMIVGSDEIAALAQLPIVPVTNKTALVRWTIGIMVEESPGGRLRQHAKLLGELETQLSQSLGRPVRLDAKLYKFQEDFAADLCAGRVDFGRIGALRYLRTRRTCPEIIPLVMPTTTYKLGMMFTRTNSGIRSVRDIRGHSVAFGDTNSTVSFWAQIKLAQQGIAATDLDRYDFLDSTLDFAEEVQDLGLSEAVQRIGFLHSHAQVIEGVLSGRYEVGVAIRKAFLIHEQRGLTTIPGTEFQSSRTLIIAKPKFEPAFVQALINAMTNLQGRWLEALPDQSPGYQPVGPKAFDVEEKWLNRTDALFPPKPPGPRIPVPVR